MRSSYKESDVVLLLKDVTGMVEPLTTEEREILIEKGMHYSEMLPVEYMPSESYINTYEEVLKIFSKPTAIAVGRLSDKIIEKKGKTVVIVSLARAGVPIGILVKRYIKFKYGVDARHYAVSIIRGKGIDKNAMKFILKENSAKDIVFVDGWIGKGKTLKELKKSLEEYPEVSSELGVVADPANETDLCGTHEDILIPSACLSSTVSGLMSRTFLRSDIIGKDDFHGAIYYEDLKDEDLSYEFIEEIEKNFEIDNGNSGTRRKNRGIEEVERIAREFNIEDINFIKPGIGEATRALLRRIPYKILLSEKLKGDVSLNHILKLAEEKNIIVEYYNLENYKACGIIKNLADV